MRSSFIFVATNKFREGGGLEGETHRVPEWVDFIQSNEPRRNAFHEYLSEQSTEVDVQFDLDADSLRNHM
jgi:hypothetical protein